MRGLYTATLISHLANHFRDSDDIDIGSAFDVIVGTSTGGILATALAYGSPIQKVIDLYQEDGPKIFTDPQPSSEGYFPRLKFLAWAWRNRKKAANSSDHLRMTMSSMWGEMTFGQLWSERKIGLCLTAVKILDEKLRVFKTPHIPEKRLDRDLCLVDACMATSAAPIYLPLAAVPDPDQPKHYEVFADGGLAANNPIMIGLIEALQLTEESQRPIQLFSIGTCSAPDGAVLSKSDLNRGLFDWKAGAKALGLSMNAQASAANFSAMFIAKCLKSYGKSVDLIRFPEEHRSEAHIKFLRLDLASPEALQAFVTFGAEDARAAYKMYTDHTPEGNMIKAAFDDMKPRPSQL